METFSALLALCVGIPQTRFLWFVPNPTVSKQWWRLWFGMPSSSLWCHCNDQWRNNVCCQIVQKWIQKWQSHVNIRCTYINQNHGHCDSSVNMICAASTCRIYRRLAQIPQCTSPISHNAPFCISNVHICTHFWYKRVQYGISAGCLVGFVKWVYFDVCVHMSCKLITTKVIFISLVLYL